MCNPMPLVGRPLRDSRTIVADAENSAAIRGGKRDRDMAGMAVFDRVVNCLLSDAIQMIGGGIIVNQHRVVAFEPASDVKEIFHLAGPVLERRHQSQGIREYRQQAREPAHESREWPRSPASRS